MSENLLTARNSRRVRRSFQRGVKSYDQHSVVQARTAERLARLLAESGAPRKYQKVLEFGCGTGRLTRCLLREFEISQIIFNDLIPDVARMLNAVTKHYAVATEFVIGPIENAPLPGDFDLVASASTVQWLPDASCVIRRLSARLNHGGWLAISGYGASQFHELRALGSRAAAPSYIDAVDWPAVLPGDVELVAAEQRPITLEFPSAVELLLHLRLTGVNGRASQRWSRSKLLAFEENYRARFGRSHNLPLTYDPVMIVAKRR